MGKTDLGKWMITNGGEYSADATYEQLTMVKYGNSTYITLKTVTGITPVDDKINYQLMAQGFDATALSAVQAEDTQGLCGEKGEMVTAQSLVDALADKVMNTVMAKIGTAALTGGMTDLSSGVNSIYSNLTDLTSVNRINVKVDAEQASLNAPERTGIYYVTGSGITALPSGFSNYGILFNMRSPYSMHPTNVNAVYSQIYIDVHNQRATRAFNNGKWTDWKTF